MVAKETGDFFLNPALTIEVSKGGDMMHFVWWILVGLIAGWAAGKIMKGSGYGTLGDIILGIVGAVIGGWIMRLLGFTGQGGTIYTILIAIVGAVILVWIMRKIKGS
jgi:uncharacterized membrane protein YeaQ/YmgE (transglycosylase-associated protein family)